jgi:predicted alpha/beta superfamily hydrolase
MIKMKLKLKVTILSTFLISSLVSAQKSDTLSFYSNAFGETRNIIIHTPEFYRFQSEKVQLPVIYVLDGQHEWFVNPVLSDIRYLQYTHQIPSALVVVIPHTKRNKECGIIDLDTPLPLDKFITEEVSEAIKNYNPGDYRIIIGHSFTASFSLFSFYKNPGFYSAVIAHSPLDEFEALVNALHNDNKVDKSDIYISVGSISPDKDFHHRKKYNETKDKSPEFFSTINTYEAEYAAHNAVPIVSNSAFLSKLFNDFSSRYSSIARVNMNYELIEEPESVSIEINKIMEASQIDGSFYPPELAEINGICSRYLNSGYNSHALKVYELGIEYYPNYYDFYLSLYDILKDSDKSRSKQYLEKAEILLKTTKIETEERDEMLQIIKSEKVTQGWE